MGQNPMKVNVKLMSIFAKYDKSSSDGKTDMKDHGTVRDLAEQLGLPIKLVRIITVNGKQVDLDTGLCEDDKIYVFPPALGGG